MIAPKALRLLVRSILLDVLSIRWAGLSARNDTAKLPRVELAWPPKVVGRTTVHAIQSGVTFG